MQSATRLSIIIPADHRLELKLPENLPPGPAEMIILAPLPGEATDPLLADEAQLDAAAEAAISQDPRFQADGKLLVFMGAIAPELEGELDHRRDREQRLAKLG